MSKFITNRSSISTRYNSNARARIRAFVFERCAEVGAAGVELIRLRHTQELMTNIASRAAILARNWPA